MSDATIPIRDILGRTITDISCSLGTQDGWLETADCTIQLDQELYIGFPFSESGDVLVREKPDNAESLFADLSDEAIYHINREGKSIQAISDKSLARPGGIFNRIKRFLLAKKEFPQEYAAYHIEYQENRFKHLKGAKIRDYLWLEDGAENGFFELDNGYVIMETKISPQGTGLAGLNYWESLTRLQEGQQQKFIRFSDADRM